MTPAIVEGYDPGPALKQFDGFRERLPGRTLNGDDAAQGDRRQPASAGEPRRLAVHPRTTAPNRPSLLTLPDSGNRMVGLAAVLHERRILIFRKIELNLFEASRARRRLEIR
jgi:hypothetical protein